LSNKTVEPTNKVSNLLNKKIETNCKLIKLHYKKDFAKIYKNGKAQLTADFLALYIKNTQTVASSRQLQNKLLQNELNKSDLLNFYSQAASFAVVVSKKVSKKAVIRNRIKRRTAEAVKQNSALFPPQIQIIFLPKLSVLDAEFSNLVKQIQIIFNKITNRINF
jgi:ribonuclease P protein component